MMRTQDVLFILLLGCILGMAVIAVFFLRKRRLPFWAYIVWGLIIALVPLAGPFLVILLQPGSKREPIQ